MLSNILIGLAVLLIVFVVIVAMRPAEFHVVRTATIFAPPAVVAGISQDAARQDAATSRQNTGAKRWKHSPRSGETRRLTRRRETRSSRCETTESR